MKIIHCVHSSEEDDMTIAIVTKTPFGYEHIEMVYNVKQVFVSDPDCNMIEVEKRDG